MKVALYTRFKLPYMGKDLFISLMRAGLVYDRAAKAFYVDLNTDRDLVNEILKERIGEGLELLKACAICGKGIDCETCEFSRDCPREGYTCICSKCMAGEDVLKRYLAAQRSIIPPLK